MSDIVIARVTRETIAQLDAGLRHLAAHLNDPYLNNLDTLEQAVCEPGTSCIALLASRDDLLMGVLLAGPIFSTARGGGGLYVSDLWVAEPARGKGLARQLLAQALREAAPLNAGHFLKLAVHLDNPDARASYKQLGFVEQTNETSMTLFGPALKL